MTHGVGARRALVSAVLAVVSLLSMGVGTASAAAPPRYDHYVALGDSYTSGPFIPWMRLSPIGCARSTNNYPSWVASRLGIGDFTDVSCGGADTTNMTKSQSVPLFGTNSPQFAALNKDTDLVTIGIGGNDYGVFGSVVNTCPTLRDSDPVGAPCQRHFTVNGVDTLLASIAKTEQNITEVVRQTRKLAPKAKVLLIGYPRIVPPTGYCPDILPMADGDYRYLDSIERALNTAVANAAKAGGGTYVDTYGPSLGHDACAGDGAAWVQGKSFNLFAAFPYHPLKAGMVAEAAIIADLLTGQQPSRARAEQAVRAAAGQRQPQVNDVNTLTQLARSLGQG
ncbi:SGNH/GDSL hydrolase family protein [Kutzneria viridogrisea]|uniref:SGNH hydrolase-type esterase domain-containing protein n=2 Tax=Kutzneria TaxID=43356 RepID=W5WJ07_9PSEU|nr:SGNH/GDSL hydrolase family protein [Kutzneria albida]AHI00597.1 hypothetical protein KALB_7239 [Kutzneria albida DSM 43870]MBA8925777.1 lysophospholipase L1-like esterase [Kutzneria viridogrisea]